MLTIDVLSDRMGLSAWQTRRIIYALKPILHGLYRSVPGQPLTVDSNALGILDRAKELRDKGVPLNGLAEVMQEELHSASNGNSEAQNGLQVSKQELANQSQELVNELRERVKDLQTRIEELKADKSSLANQVKELQTLALPSNSEGRKQLTRWQHLVQVFTG